MVIIDSLRVLATLVGVIVILMWLAGTVGLGHFELRFAVLP